MNFSELKAFCLVANEGTLQHAAESLKLTPAAISVQIRRLEAEIGINLFLRTPNKLLLTDAGRTYVELRLEGGLVHEICIRGKRGSLCVTDAEHLFPHYDGVPILRNDRPPDPSKKSY